MRTLFLLVIAITFGIGARVCEADPELKSVEIPLKEIWALDMTGTRNVREMPAARQDEQIVESIRRSLESAPDQEKAAKGFVVLGMDDDALRSARDILVENKRRTSQFAAGAKLSAIFFSYQSGMYVHLRKVERVGNLFRIEYQLVPHESAETTAHFALIPLGALPQGKYSVSIKQAREKNHPQGIIPPPESAVVRTVCSSFEFVVEE